MTTFPKYSLKACKINNIITNQTHPWDRELYIDEPHIGNTNITLFLRVI